MSEKLFIWIQNTCNLVFSSGSFESSDAEGERGLGWKSPLPRPVSSDVLAGRSAEVDTGGADFAVGSAQETRGDGQKSADESLEDG